MSIGHYGGRFNTWITPHRDLLRHLPQGRRWLWGSALGIAVLGTLGVFLKADHAKDLADPARARSAGRPIPVRTAQVSRTEVDQVVGATAVTVPSEISAVRVGVSRDMSSSVPESDLAVQYVHVQEGDRVEAGQILFELNDEVFRQRVRQREAALATAQAELDRVRDTIVLNQKVRQLTLTGADSGSQLRNDISGIWKGFCDMIEPLARAKAAKEWDYYQSRIGMMQSRFDLNAAMVAWKLAEANMAIGDATDKRDLTKAVNDCEIARIDLAVAQRNLEKCRVKSPLDGYISKLDLVTGSIINAGADVGQVIRLNPLFVRVDFPQERIDDLSAGREVEIVLDSLPKETFRGQIIRILPMVKAELRVLPVIVRLDNPNHRLKAGISGFVRIHIAKSALTVPSVAVIESGGKSIVFRIEDGRARIREIHTGHLIETGVVEVMGGLEPGDEVVVFHSNFYRHGGSLTSKDCYLEDNDPVDVDWRKWARRE